MKDTFEIPVIYKGKEIIFSAQLVTTGFSYKINVDFFDHIISFERDDENYFRALLRNEDIQNEPKLDKALIKEIGNTIELLFNDKC